VYQDEDGMVVVRGRMTPEAGAVLLQALAAARETLYQQKRQTFDNLGDVSAETLPYEQQQADALALLAESALHHGIDPGAPGERYQVVVHVDAPVLADPEAPGQSVLEDGVRVSAEPIMWLAPLPVPLKLVCSCSEEPEVADVTGATEPDAEPDPGRPRYPIVSTQRAAVITNQEILR
jgi:Domain of unknown function (DUF222)